MGDHVVVRQDSGVASPWDVVVVGAGVIGLAAGVRLASAGHRTTVVERRRAGAGASTVAAGLLAPTDEVSWRGDLGSLNRRALSVWPDYADQVADLAGRPVGFRPCGSLRIDPGDDGSASWLDTTEAGMEHLGLPAERLDEAACRALVPHLGAVRGGLHTPADASVDTERVVAALVDAFVAVGGQLQVGEVVGLRVAGERVTGVDLADGGRVEGGTIVVAAGPWTAVADWLPPPCRPDLVPVAGEAVLVDGADGLLDLPVRTRHGPIVPRDEGRLWIGTSVRRDGFVTRPKVGEVASLLTRAAEVVPPIATLEIADVRVGLRPVSADGMPHVGPTGREGLLLATGHGREGIAHAPVAAEALAGWIEDGDAPDWARSMTPRLADDRS